MKATRKRLKTVQLSVNEEVWEENWELCSTHPVEWVGRRHKQEQQVPEWEEVMSPSGKPIKTQPLNNSVFLLQLKHVDQRCFYTCTSHSKTQHITQRLSKTLPSCPNRASSLICRVRTVRGEGVCVCVQHEAKCVCEQAVGKRSSVYTPWEGRWLLGGREEDTERETKQVITHPIFPWVPLPLVTPPQHLHNQDSHSITEGEQKAEGGGGTEIHTQTSSSCCSITQYWLVRCVYSRLVAPSTFIPSVSLMSMSNKYDEVRRWVGFIWQHSTNLKGLKNEHKIKLAGLKLLQHVADGQWW